MGTAFFLLICAARFRGTGNLQGCCVLIAESCLIYGLENLDVSRSACGVKRGANLRNVDGGYCPKCS